jgi:PAS domain S-box-containing protein
MWQWKDDPEKIVPKISYVKKFEPWGWIIGTGLYIDDVHAEVAVMRNKFTVLSVGILLIVSLLALYTIRQSLIADRERERLMKSLEESTARYRNLLETTSDWIWETDKDGRYTYSSPQVTNLLGYQPEEVVNTTLVHLASPNQAAILSSSLAKLLAAKKPFNGFEITCLGKSGQIVVFENNAVPILDGQGILQGYRGVGRDITERKWSRKHSKKAAMTCTPVWRKP